MPSPQLLSKKNVSWAFAGGNRLKNVFHSFLLFSTCYSPEPVRVPPRKLFWASKSPGTPHQKIRKSANLRLLFLLKFFPERLSRPGETPSGILLHAVSTQASPRDPKRLLASSKLEISMLLSGDSSRNLVGNYREHYVGTLALLLVQSKKDWEFIQKLKFKTPSCLLKWGGTFGCGFEW